MNINELTPLQENNISFLFLFYRSVGFVSVILSYQQRGNKLSCKSFCPHLEHIKTMPFFFLLADSFSPFAYQLIHHYILNEIARPRPSPKFQPDVGKWEAGFPCFRIVT
ncbi:mCG1032883 [Mus musculus]|jgi:hypothetical protein|nr:mCG1032883 [Mus musculus]